MNPTLWPYLVGTGLAHGLIVPWWGFLRLIGRDSPHRRQRLGRYPEARPAGSGTRLWMQAVSVGEVRLAAALLGALKDRRPDIDLILSTGTSTGQAEARRLAGDLARVVYFPLDTPPSVRRALSCLSPDLAVMVETELWPNFLREAGRRGIGLALVNGRISDRSDRSYRRLRPFFRPLLSRFRTVGAISQKDARRLTGLGAPAERTVVTGNAKAASLGLQADPQKAARLGRELGLDGRPVWVAGSIRSGEERIVIEAFKKVLETRPETVLVLAPRHLDKAEAMTRELEMAGLDYTRRTEPGGEAQTRVLVLDTLGELFQVYYSARVALVGGGLMPLAGHNPLEPAFWHKPVLFGPHMDSFAGQAEALVSAGGGLVIEDARELARAVIELLGDDDRRQAMGRAAGKVCAADGQGFERTIDLLVDLVDMKGGK